MDDVIYGSAVCPIDSLGSGGETVKTDLHTPPCVNYTAKKPRFLADHDLGAR